MCLVLNNIASGKMRKFAFFLLLTLTEMASAQGPSPALDHPFSSNHFTTALHQGVSSFIFPLPKGKEHIMSLVNQNPAAEGCFSIAVSTRRLPVDSSHWNAIGEAINFRHHRQFAVSLEGVEANYVRLTFDVHRARAMGT